MNSEANIKEPKEKNNKFYYLNSEEEEALNIFYSHQKKFEATKSEMALLLYELKKTHKINYRSLTDIYEGFVLKGLMTKLIAKCKSSLSEDGSLSCINNGVIKIPQPKKFYENDTNYEYETYSKYGTYYENETNYEYEAEFFKQTMEDFYHGICIEGISKKYANSYFPQLTLNELRWKSIKILLKNSRVLELFHLLIKECKGNLYYVMNEIFEWAEMLKWKESKFRRLLKRDMIEINYAFIKRFILKKDKNFSEYFDKFYLPWMKPYLELALEYKRELFEERELEEEEKPDHSNDWWNGIEPDFDLDEVSDPDLRDSLGDLF